MKISTNSEANPLVADLDLDEENVPLEEETAPPAGPLANVLCAIAPLAIGVAGTVGAVELGLGSPVDPGPGLWPMIICLVTIIVSVALLIGGKRFHDAEKMTRGSVTVGIGVLTLIALVVALPIIGFEIPSLVLVFVWLRFLGRESWLLSGITSVVVTVVFYFLFIVGLGIPLPRLF